MKGTKKKLLTAGTVAAVLALSFWWGGSAPGLQGGVTAPPPAAAVTSAPTSTSTPAGKPTPEQAPASTPAAAVESPPPSVPVPNAPDPVTPAPPVPTPTEGVLPAPPPKAAEAPKGTPPLPSGPQPTASQTPEVTPAAATVPDRETGKDRYLTDPVPAGKPLPVEPEDAAVSDRAYTCTLSVSCATILDHVDWLDPEKRELLPEDGVIFPPTAVTFYEGESVFNVLTRTMKKNKIHLEFVDTPLYHSAYIEGIANLYEFDCGELSGWMYSVNGWFPNYGCSRYQLGDGDVISWVYTCDLGADVGGGTATGNGAD